MGVFTYTYTQIANIVYVLWTPSSQLLMTQNSSLFVFVLAPSFKCQLVIMLPSELMLMEKR